MKKLICLLLALMMVLALCACGSSSSQSTADSAAADTTAAADTSAAAADGDRVLRIGTTETMQSYSPTATGGRMMNVAYEYLITKDEDGNFVNWLAEDIEWVDNMTLQIKVRDDVTFQDGNPLTGEDVLYSLYYASADRTSMTADKFAHVDYDASYVEDDGLTVVLKMKDEYSFMYSWLAMAVITEKATASELASDEPTWWDEPISTSAYVLTENVDGSHCTFKLRDDYWDTENMPQWDEITFYYYANATAMFIAFENGELDVVFNVDSSDYDRAVAGETANADTVGTSLVAVNSPLNICLGAYCEYFQDAKVREAIFHAIDPDAIGTVAYGSLYTTADSLLSDQFGDAYESQGGYEYDVELAKQCMAESSYPDGFEITWMVQEVDSLALEVVQAELAEIGITLNVETYDFATLLQNLLVPGNTDAAFWGGQRNSVDACEAISPYYNGNALTCTRIMDEDYNALYNSLPTIFDTDEQNEVLHEMQQWHHENMWIYPVVTVNQAYVYDASKVDFHMTDISLSRVQYDITLVA